MKTGCLHRRSPMERMGEWLVLANDPLHVRARRTHRERRAARNGIFLTAMHKHEVNINHHTSR